MQIGMKDFYRDHLNKMQELVRPLLEIAKKKRLVLGSGAPTLYFQDDQGPSFHGFHHFLHFVPYERANLYCIVEATGKPRLLVHTPDDYWHEQEPIGELWLDCLEVQTFKTLRKMHGELANLTDDVWLLADGDKYKVKGEVAAPGLVNLLAWRRAFKTPFEIECMKEASRLAVAGHRAAEKSFRSGASEIEIQAAFCAGSGQRETALAYNPIVACDEKAAILHYQNLRGSGGGHRSLLIDAGCRYLGYCSDITRTYADSKGDFAELIARLDSLQQELCEAAGTTKSFLALHELARRKIASLLLEVDLVTDLSVDAILEEQIVDRFFPHGLGHLLGIFVHDVGGHLLDANGNLFQGEIPKNLRTSRNLEEGMVFTIEPGLYFIDSLLSKLKASADSEYVNWPLVEKLRPYGGIRIEDNVLRNAKGVENLTRQCF